MQLTSYFLAIYTHISSVIYTFTPKQPILLPNLWSQQIKYLWLVSVVFLYATNNENDFCFMGVIDREKHFMFDTFEEHKKNSKNTILSCWRRTK